MTDQELSLGARVSATDTLVRVRDYMPGGMKKRWVRGGEGKYPITKPVVGILVGIRQLDVEGKTWFGGYDESTTWERTGERRTAVQIAFDLRQKPAMAWLDDVTIEPELTPEALAAAADAIRQRLQWPSLHWGTEDLHADAIPHIAQAALEAVMKP